ncbi:Non-specific serine/threonine protein kinase [Handroanthus impetiginosus]|uniref:Non-specific serine/threonine protein kinase n=1 Tax=Handroanthus impetiginosus TaxID=429701 RepID=A0A2G9G8G3_9LAMI|nr:Non-specific serine/threonine protein kinase [Handroanthus impetiginosus]
MSTDSSSRSFHKAIQGALDEVGRLVESDMTCKCVPLEKRDGLARPVVENAGLKPGVLAPEVDILRLSIPQCEPAEILSKVMRFAKGDSVDSALEVAVLKSSLSAFYRAKGGYQLPEYHEPVYIEGLEDKNKDESAVANDFSIPIEVPIVGPKEAEWPSSSTDAVERLSDSSNVKIYYRRKQKSVAELMAANTDIKPKNQKRATVKESKDVGKSSSSLKKKKRNHGEVEQGGSEGASRKQKVAVSEPTKMTNEKVSDAENSGDGDVDEKQKKIEVAAAENTSGEAEMVSTPRERKKSKYLSPPYADPRWKMGSSSTKIESKPVKITKTDHVGEQTRKASEDFRGSPPLSKNVDEAPDDKLTIRQLKLLEKTSVVATPQTVENDKKMSFSASDVDFAAVNPLYLSNEGSLDMVRAFFSALRSSTFLHGPDYQIFQKCKRSKKRKSTPSRLQDEENDSKSAHKKKTRKAEKTEERPDTSKSKKASEIPLEQKKSEGNASLCLILTFTPEYPLPSKEEVIKLFGKFGRLNEKETSVITDSHAVQITYMKDSDAEVAFKSSINESPFGIENVNYWLQHGSKPRGAFLPPFKWGLEKTESSDDYMTVVRMIRQKIEIMTAIVENYHSKFSAEDKTSLKDEMKHLMDSVEMASEKVRLMAEKTSASS